MNLLRRLLFVLLLAGMGVLAFYYFGTYSEGVRSGVVVKISRKGYLFKTYEGQLNLMTFGAVRSQNLVSESFEFSVSSGQTDLIKQLEQASLSGERVSLHYKERFGVFPWRGDTKYFVTELTRQP